MFKLIIFIFSLFIISTPAIAEYSAGLNAYSDGDYVLSLEEFRDSARMGHAKSEFMLGVQYFNGLGVEKNRSIAAIYFHLAAERGNPEAQLAFGSIFIKGVGVWQNLVYAHYWLTLAADHNDSALQEHAEALKIAMESLMTKKEIETSNQLASDWHNGRSGLVFEN